MYIWSQILGFGPFPSPNCFGRPEILRFDVSTEYVYKMLSISIDKFYSFRHNAVHLGADGLLRSLICSVTYIFRSCPKSKSRPMGRPWALNFFLGKFTIQFEFQKGGNFQFSFENHIVNHKSCMISFLFLSSTTQN